MRCSTTDLANNGSNHIKLCGCPHNLGFCFYVIDEDHYQHIHLLCMLHVIKSRRQMMIGCGQSLPRKFGTSKHRHDAHRLGFCCTIIDMQYTLYASHDKVKKSYWMRIGGDRSLPRKFGTSMHRHPKPSQEIWNF